MCCGAFIAGDRQKDASFSVLYVGGGCRYSSPTKIANGDRWPELFRHRQIRGRVVGIQVMGTSIRSESLEHQINRDWSSLRSFAYLLRPGVDAVAQTVLSAGCPRGPALALPEKVERINIMGLGQLSAKKMNDKNARLSRSVAKLKNHQHQQHYRQQRETLLPTARTRTTENNDSGNQRKNQNKNNSTSTNPTTLQRYQQRQRQQQRQQQRRQQQHYPRCNQRAV